MGVEPQRVVWELTPRKRESLFPIFLHKCSRSDQQLKNEPTLGLFTSTEGTFVLQNFCLELFLSAISSIFFHEPWEHIRQEYISGQPLVQYFTVCILQCFLLHLSWKSPKFSISSPPPPPLRSHCLGMLPEAIWNWYHYRKITSHPGSTRKISGSF